MKLSTKVFILAATAVLVTELLVVPFELRYVHDLSGWLGYGFVWSMSNLRRLGDIVIRWDIVSFEICVTITFAFVAYTFVPRRMQQPA